MCVCVGGGGGNKLRNFHPHWLSGIKLAATSMAGPGGEGGVGGSGF